MSEARHHSPIEDAQGIAAGIFFAALGIHVLTFCGLITGQTAGVAVVIAYLTGWSFGPVFFVVNLPFYWLGWKKLGRTFTITSFISVTLLSVVTELLPHVIVFERVNPAVGAITFGAITGMGLLALFRHHGSLGGGSILALYAQERYKVQAGYVQLAFDAVLFTVAFFLFDPYIVLLSLLGAAVLNLFVAINHRRDRYIAT